MNLLITGGAGYIGSHIVKLLGKTGGFDIATLDNLSTGRKEAVLFGRFIKADLSDFASIEKIIKKGQFDAVIHFAASIIVPESVANPLKYYMNNTVNTANLINLCNKYGINKFVFS
jgi:UDP-glucose 4-epimerase